MSKLSEQLASLLKDAMRARDTVSLNSLRALKTALTNASIEKGSLTTVLDEAEEVAVVRKQVVQRQDAATQFAGANRPELAEIELAEIAVLEQFLPTPLGAEEVATMLDEVIAETGASSKKDMGRVMKAMQERAAGRIDGKELSKLVATHLN